VAYELPEGLEELHIVPDLLSSFFFFLFPEVRGENRKSRKGYAAYGRSGQAPCRVCPS